MADHARFEIREAQNAAAAKRTALYEQGKGYMDYTTTMASEKAAEAAALAGQARDQATMLHGRARMEATYAAIYAENIKNKGTRMAT